MKNKINPLGICDFCSGPIPPGQWMTTKGTPRLHCSLECKQAANSRAGNPVRIAKMRERIKNGEWINPSRIRPPTPREQASRARIGRLREVASGLWRNPALDENARIKLSAPRKHSGILRNAIRKLRKMSMADLDIEEQKAYREYRRKLRESRQEEVNRLARERYLRRKNEKQ